jgi:hypothetical protein
MLTRVGRALAMAICVVVIGCGKAHASLNVTGAGSTSADPADVVCTLAPDPKQELVTIRWGERDFKGTLYLRLAGDGRIDYFDLLFGHVTEAGGPDLLGREVKFDSYVDSVRVAVDRDPAIVVGSGATTRAGRLTFTRLAVDVYPEPRGLTSARPEISGSVEWACP